MEDENEDNREQGNNENMEIDELSLNMKNNELKSIKRLRKTLLEAEFMFFHKYQESAESLLQVPIEISENIPDSKRKLEDEKIPEKNDFILKKPKNDIILPAFKCAYISDENQLKKELDTLKKLINVNNSPKGKIILYGRPKTDNDGNHELDKFGNLKGDSELFLYYDLETFKNNGGNGEKSFYIKDYSACKVVFLFGDNIEANKKFHTSMKENYGEKWFKNYEKILNDPKFPDIIQGGGGQAATMLNNPKGGASSKYVPNVLGIPTVGNDDEILNSIKNNFLIIDELLKQGFTIIIPAINENNHNLGTGIAMSGGKPKFLSLSNSSRETILNDFKMELSKISVIDYINLNLNKIIGEERFNIQSIINTTKSENNLSRSQENLLLQKLWNEAFDKVDEKLKKELVGTSVLSEDYKLDTSAINEFILQNPEVFSLFGKKFNELYKNEINKEKVFAELINELVQNYQEKHIKDEHIANLDSPKDLTPDNQFDNMEIDNEFKITNISNNKKERVQRNKEIYNKLMSNSYRYKDVNVIFRINIMPNNEIGLDESIFNPNSKAAHIAEIHGRGQIPGAGKKQFRHVSPIALIEHMLIDPIEEAIKNGDKLTIDNILCNLIHIIDHFIDIRETGIVLNYDEFSKEPFLNEIKQKIDSFPQGYKYILIKEDLSKISKFDYTKYITKEENEKRLQEWNQEKKEFIVAKIFDTFKKYLSNTETVKQGTEYLGELILTEYNRHEGVVYPDEGHSRKEEIRYYTDKEYKIIKNASDIRLLPKNADIKIVNVEGSNVSSAIKKLQEISKKFKDFEIQKDLLLSLIKSDKRVEVKRTNLVTEIYNIKINYLDKLPENIANLAKSFDQNLLNEYIERLNEQNNLVEHLEADINIKDTKRANLIKEIYIKENNLKISVLPEIIGILYEIFDYKKLEDFVFVELKALEKKHIPKDSPDNISVNGINYEKIGKNYYDSNYSPREAQIKLNSSDKKVCGIVPGKIVRDAERKNAKHKIKMRPEIINEEETSVIANHLCRHLDITFLTFPYLEKNLHAEIVKGFKDKIIQDYGLDKIGKEQEKKLIESKVEIYMKEYFPYYYDSSNSEYSKDSPNPDSPNRESPNDSPNKSSPSSNSPTEHIFHETTFDLVYNSPNEDDSQEYKPGELKITFEERLKLTLDNSPIFDSKSPSPEKNSLKNKIIMSKQDQLKLDKVKENLMNLSKINEETDSEEEIPLNKRIKDNKDQGPARN